MIPNPVRSVAQDSPLVTLLWMTTMHSRIRRKIPMSAPQVRACVVQPPQRWPSSSASQQWLWEQTMAPHTRHSAGVLLSPVTELEHEKFAERFIRSV